MITKITDYTKWLHGKRPLPAGAVPLAAENQSSLICLMPSGRWIRWISTSISSFPPEIQKDVMEVVIIELGGTAQAASDALDVSKRTVEAWRSGRSPLPISKAYKIAEIISKSHQ